MSNDSERIALCLQSPSVDLEALASILDGLTLSARVSAVRSINGKAQARLWEASKGRGVTIDEIVPPELGPDVEVIYAGKNSLPMFTHFEKRFCRAFDAPGCLYGYNEGAVRPLIGPGYFVVRYFEDRSEAGVDYYQVPPDGASLPPNWPGIKANERGLQRFVYAKMVDYLRRVSNGVFIGRAVRKGKDTNNYFLLCRAHDVAALS